MSASGKNVLMPEQNAHASPEVDAINLRDAEVTRAVEIMELAEANIPETQTEQPVATAIDFEDYPELSAELAEEPIEEETTPSPLIPIGAFQTKRPVEAVEEVDEIPHYSDYSQEDREPEEEAPLAPVVPLQRRYVEEPAPPTRPAAIVKTPAAPVVPVVPVVPIAPVVPIVPIAPVENYQEQPVLPLRPTARIEAALAPAVPIEDYQVETVLAPETLAEIEAPEPEIPDEYILAARARTDIARIHSVQAQMPQQPEFAEKDAA
jgi:hypothetical protein